MYVNTLVSVKRIPFEDYNIGAVTKDRIRILENASLRYSHINGVTFHDFSQLVQIDRGQYCYKF